MQRAYCIAVRDEREYDTRTSEEMHAHSQAGTVGSHTIDCLQVSIGVVAVLLVLQHCE